MAAFFAECSAISNHDLTQRTFRTKNSMESKFTTARKLRYGSSKTLRRVLRSASFSLGKKRQKTVLTVENYGGTTDSGAVLFLVRKGPLGLPRFEITAIALLRFGLLRFFDSSARLGGCKCSPLLPGEDR